MSHQCPAPECRKNVPDHMLACRVHWWQLPAPLRARINEEYRLAGESLELRVLHQEAIEVWSS